jgi:c-di-GMP-binding flagellar brake protein YcgR/CheY-like chemotaxis protein
VAVENHFREISDLKVSVQVIFDNGLDLPDCQVIYKKHGENEFTLTVRAGEFTEDGKVNVRYGIGDKAYAFETRIARIEIVDADSVSLYMPFPETIAEFDRRKHFRVFPSKDKPIKVRLDLPNGETIYLEAIDISLSGIAFAIPKAISFYGIGAECIMNLAISRIGDLRLTGAVVSTRTVFDVTRLGVEFRNASESDRRMLAQYVNTRELEGRGGTGVGPKHEQGKIFVISDDGGKERFAFLYKRFSVTQTKPFNAIAELTDSLPSLILLDCDRAATQILLHAFKKHIFLRNIPVIVSGEATRMDHETGDYIVDMDGPINYRSYVKMIDKLVGMSNFVKSVKRRWEGLVGIDRKIVVVDRFNYLSSRYLDYFRALNFEISVVDNEDTLLERIQESMPDIVIIDEEREKMDLPTLCRLIDENRGISMIPRVLMTKDKALARKHLKGDLITGFVVKPFNQRQLFLEVAGALMKRISAVPGDPTP